VRLNNRLRLRRARRASIKVEEIVEGRTVLARLPDDESHGDVRLPHHEQPSLPELEPGSATDDAGKWEAPCAHDAAV
jgi:hypothetical protein